MVPFLDLVRAELEYARRRHPRAIVDPADPARIIRAEFDEFLSAARR